MTEAGSRWRPYRTGGHATIWTVLGWAPRARGGPNNDEPVLRIRSNNGSLRYVHPDALVRYYQRLSDEPGKGS